MWVYGLCGCLVLCLWQFVVVMGIVWWVVVPFWAVRARGIWSLCVQGFPLAASAELGPWGRVSSKVPTGSSGMARSVPEVIPFLLMYVSLRSCMVTP